MRVLMVGSAPQSPGGVASVIRLMTKMPFWKECHCHWLGTQIQSNYVKKAWYAIKSYIEAFFTIWRYDIIHFHAVPDHSLIVQLPVFLLALLWHKKIIMQMHVGNQLSNYTHSRLFLWHLRHTNLIVFLAHKWQTLFEREFASVKVPSAVVYNATEYVPSVDWSEKAKLIMMAAYFNDNKAPDVLFRAWQSIYRKHPDWKIAMLGNGEVERFKTMAEDMGLGDCVIFTGYITGKDKEDYFRKASIYCMCSYEEGFPMVTLEAWAYGICLITTPVGGLPDVLEPGKNALVFDFGDASGLARCLENLISSPEFRQEIATNARNYVYSHFSIQKINNDWINIYKHLNSHK